MFKNNILGLDLKEIKPRSIPSGILHYMDFKYPDLLEERRKK